MAQRKMKFSLSGVLKRVRSNSGLKLPDDVRAGFRPRVQMMHTPVLDSEFMRDLRVSARDTGKGFRGR